MENTDEVLKALVEKMQEHNSLQIEVSLLNGHIGPLSLSGMSTHVPVQVTGSITVYALIYTSYRPSMRLNTQRLFKGLAGPLIFDNTDIDELYLTRVQSDREVCEIYIISKDQH